MELETIERLAKRNKEDGRAGIILPVQDVLTLVWQVRQLAEENAILRRQVRQSPMREPAGLVAEWRQRRR